MTLSKFTIILKLLCFNIQGIKVLDLTMLTHSHRNEPINDQKITLRIWFLSSFAASSKLFQHVCRNQILRLDRIKY